MFIRRNPRGSPLIVLTLIVLACMAGCSDKEEPPRPAPPYLPMITEISPQGTATDLAWIELHNPTDRAVDASGLALEINDDIRYVVSRNLPPMPPQSYVVVRLGANPRGEDDFRFDGKVAILHAGPRFAELVGRRSGQIAVYRSGEPGQEELVDFVAWGAPATLRSLTPERDRIWRKDWFVPQVRTFGDFDENMAAQVQDFSIARYPGSVGRDLGAWVVLYGDDRTPGAPNRVPGVGMFTLADDATVHAEDISVGWTASKWAQSFRFQIARDEAFRDIVEDVSLTSALYRPASTLPPGRYYYRVKVLDTEGRESNWSRVMRLNSRLMGSSRSEDGAITAEVLLTDMQYRRQRKDSGLLCLDGCASHLDGSTTKHWDNRHPDAVPVGGDHGDMNCVRASISMMVSFYGRDLSQDRIAYFTQEERAGVGNGIPELDLAHGDGMGYSAEETAALEWALDVTISDFFDSPNPSFADLKGWLDSSRPIMTRTPGHLRAMNGYREEDDGTEWVHILDPWSGERWETYTTWNGGARGTWVGPTTAPTAREDEPEIATDSDGDGVMGFDEQIRFGTGRFDADSDNDDVQDKEDIYEYVFQFGDTYAKRDADFDTDGVRKEIDPDNDADSYNDGCEDKNRNGVFESAAGETDNFAADTGLVCGTNPAHVIIVLDRSGSMSSPASDPKFDRATEAATLFLDAWLANDPPTGTEVGLVYYDHAAHFDDAAGTNTTRGALTEAKRDLIVASFPGNEPAGGSTCIGGAILEAMEPQGFDVGTASADGLKRVLVVLTDGKENTGTRMDDPAVTQALVDNHVDGYVLGIGDEIQISEDKLSTLAEILNHPPASLAKDLDEFQLEKFFLQVLAETQGMEFSMDPPAEIAIGQTRDHSVPVNPGAERVTFVVAWNESGGRIDFTLKDPAGQPVNADVTKKHNRYQVSTKSSPAPGYWTLTVTASSDAPPHPTLVHYSIMALENNPTSASVFRVHGVRYAAGDRILLTAMLSRFNKALIGGEAVVHVTRPTVGTGTFVSRARVEVPRRMPYLERGIDPTPAQMKLLAMASQQMTVPTTTESIALNDRGRNGDHIPGDGIYSALFDQSRFDGIYMFRFVGRAGAKEKVPELNREKIVSAYFRPVFRAGASLVDMIEREYRPGDKRTYLKLNVTLKDRLGNDLGPGRADVLKRIHEAVEVLRIVDNLNGSYEVELTVPGQFEGNPWLVPTLGAFDARQSHGKR